MDYVTLGRTGLRASVAGLGCGGFSTLGLRVGKSEANAISLVRLALDLGVNLLDTGSDYGTEGVVGKAIKSVARDKVIVNTKTSIGRNGNWATPEMVVAGLEKSLATLGTDYIDVFQFHSFPVEAYDYTMTMLVPVLERQKEKGKLRHLGLSEGAVTDAERHDTLQRAIKDDCWGTGMIAFHMMHQNPIDLVFAQNSGSHRLGILAMCVVRNVFSQPGRLIETMQKLVDQGQLPARFIENERPLDFLVHAGGASSVTDAAYRYARHQKGVDVVLFGTSDPDHLRSNVKSILEPPLPESDLVLIASQFGHLVGTAIDQPNHMGKAPRYN